MFGVFLKEQNIHNGFRLAFTCFGTWDFYSVMLVWWLIKIRKWGYITQTCNFFFYVLFLSDIFFLLDVWSFSLFILAFLVWNSYVLLLFVFGIFFLRFFDLAMVLISIPQKELGFVCWVFLRKRWADIFSVNHWKIDLGTRWCLWSIKSDGNPDASLNNDGNIFSSVEIVFL